MSCLRRQTSRNQRLNALDSHRRGNDSPTFQTSFSTLIDEEPHELGLMLWKSNNGAVFTTQIVFYCVGKEYTDSYRVIKSKPAEFCGWLKKGN